ncbi:hypothetical protein TraAM80_02779 [Trypanosoma rangeli]|uniref:Uncharacterized protein n=1 Tax=Trypanosoma rangeli TaxID=5698 RepID=A0A422NSR5_TRYRA|nr:uncharacterized protein TraAM80_02779 [Trypanosoma rangeli]RNF08542.1 hypothetical protein TraAM80_02779 [Trypanosoma rangeli]|eukprot:RNF08542.1 hypothetical protein TraAM80_02779 [Trypanosoma rangeli]
MLRRSSGSLFRRTPIRRSGGELFVRPTLDQIPPAEECKGFFGRLNGSRKFLRFVDLKWMMNRAVAMRREYLITTPTLYAFLWMFSWGGASMYFWGDRAPPRRMDWNTEETGHLPHNFEPTVLRKSF